MPQQWVKTVTVSFLFFPGITTAFGLKHYPLWKAKKQMTFTGFRTVQELNGITATITVPDKAGNCVFFP
jgi:hypothetical protein